MDKVVCFDTANGQFRLYFPKSDAILACVRDLPVRKFQRVDDDAFWMVGSDHRSALALARLAFTHDFIVESAAAARIVGAFDATKAGIDRYEPVEANITGRFSAGMLISVVVKCGYNEGLVELLRSLPGSRFDKSHGWTVPAHDRAMGSVYSLARGYNLTVDVALVEAVQSHLKKSGPAGYADLCAQLDTLRPSENGNLLTGSQNDTSKSLPPFAVLPTAFVTRWIADAPARQKKAREMVIGNRVGKRAAERARDRGFETEAMNMTPSQIMAVHRNLRELAGVCDGAATIDSVGFNGPDAKVGRGLAMMCALEPIHAAYARSFLKKYVRQLGDAAIEAMS
jgi:hypothetical protein